MKNLRKKISIEEIKRLYAIKKPDIQRRIKDFSNIKPKDYFYELIYCLLTPQSSAVNAEKVVNILKDKKFHIRQINLESILRQKDCYIRFHKTKSKHILKMKKQFPEIMNELKKSKSGEELRLWLVNNVKGLGWKESSHFLRNIGYRNLAILDRHILRNLKRLGVITKLLKTLNAKKYLQIEKKFKKFSKRIGISIDELDLLFWSMETGKIMK